jgi:hypothetical protein
MPPEETRPLGDPNAGGPIVGPGDRMPEVAPRRRPLVARLLPILIVVVALGGFGGIVGYYYLAGSAGGSTAEAVAPLIKADQRPVRVRPENPGGMDVPHQDKEIYDRVGNRGTPPATPERLLPPPETPIARPQGAAPSGGAMASPPASTMAAAPPRPAGTPPLLQPNVPPPPDVSPPPPSQVTSQAVIPPPATAAAPLPTPRPPVTTPPPSSFAGTATAPAGTPSRPGASRVVLASVQSEGDAQREWQRLQRAHGDALSGLAPEFVRTDLGDRGVFWRIYVGPAEAAPDAQARCAALKQRQVNCFVARP